MNIRVKATDFQMTPDVQAYLDSRVASLQKLLVGFEDVARVEVELGRDAGRPRHGANIWFAEMHVIVPGGEHVYARNNSESINGAIAAPYINNKAFKGYQKKIRAEQLAAIPKEFSANKVLKRKNKHKKGGAIELRWMHADVEWRN